MATTAWKTAGTVSEVGSGSSWSPGGGGSLQSSLSADDNVYATCTFKGGGTSKALRFRNFDFSDLPSDATDISIEIELRRFQNPTYGTTLADTVLQLVVHSANTSADRIGSNLASGTAWPTTEAAGTYGGATNVWGVSPTEAQVKDASFGFDLAVGAASTAQGSVDLGRMRVHYSTSVDLTADNLSTAAPTLGSPALGLIVALTATALAAAAPVLGTPALAQEHALTADGLNAGAPVLDTPAVVEATALFADELATGQPTLGTPAFGQVHALTADEIAPVPVLGEPALGQVHDLGATDLASGAPVLGSPALAEAYALVADGITVAAPTLGEPGLGQVHGLVASGISAGSPVLGTPQLVITIEAITPAERISGVAVSLLAQRTSGVARSLLVDRTGAAD